MSRLSREKGKRGERQWRDALREAGFTARRGQQFAGSSDSPDVICEELGSVHFEVKVGQHPPVLRAMEQAKRDGGPSKVPIVASRRDGERMFLVTMEAGVFFALLRDGIEGLRNSKFQIPTSREIPITNGQKENDFGGNAKGRNGNGGLEQGKRERAGEQRQSQVPVRSI